DFGWVPASPRCARAIPGLTCAPQAVTASPAALATLTAALTSRSSHAPHEGHCQARTWSGLLPSFTPQAEHVREVGTNRPIRWNSRPYSRALYSSMPTNDAHPASWTDLASRVRPSPRTARSSTATAWLSRISAVESWWWKSRRASATFACARATLTRALSRLREPFCLRDRSRCRRLRFFSARRRKRGDSIFRPSDNTAKCVSPKSMPTTGSVLGRASGTVSTTKLAKYRPAESLTTVTLEGWDGSGRDHRTGTSPIFGSRSFPLDSTLNRALAVNRIACR